jgi:hypothetical protein
LIKIVTVFNQKYRSYREERSSDILSIKVQIRNNKQPTQQSQKAPSPIMTTPLEKLLGHLRQKEWTITEMMVKTDYHLLTMTDAKGLMPLDHAIMNDAPYDIIQ